jgi:hypothetical protein
MLSPSPLSRPREDSYDLNTGALLHWRSNDLGLETVRGDQTPTFSSPTNGKGARDKLGRLRQLVIGVERFHMVDIDGDGIFEVPVLLLERSPTQTATAAEDLTNAAYTLTNASIIADATAPNGQPTADKLTETTANGRHTIQQNIGGTITDNVVTSGAWFVRAAERTWVVIESVNKAGTSAKSYFNLTTGAWGTVAGSHTVRAEKWGAAWYRLSVSVDMASGGTSPRFTIGTATGNGTDSFAGTTFSGLYIWGWHVETNKAVVGSYPPATGVETLQWAYSGIPQPISVYVHGLELGTIAENVGLLDIGGNAGSPPRLTIGASGGFYRAILHNGSTSVTRTLGVAPAIGDWVELLCTLTPVAGSILNEVTVDLKQSINGGAQTAVGASSAIALPTAWGAPLVTVNQLSNDASGLFGFRDIGLWPGAQTFDDLRGLV